MNNNAHNNADKHERTDASLHEDEQVSQDQFPSKYYTQVLLDKITDHGKVMMMSNDTKISAMDIIAQAKQKKIPLEQVLQTMYLSYEEREKIVTEVMHVSNQIPGKLFAIMIVAAWLVITAMYFQSTISVIAVIVCALLSMSYVCIKVLPYWRLANLVTK